MQQMISVPCYAVRPFARMPPRPRAFGLPFVSPVALSVGYRWTALLPIKPIGSIQSHCSSVDILADCFRRAFVPIHP